MLIFIYLLWKASQARSITPILGRGPTTLSLLHLFSSTLDSVFLEARQTSLILAYTWWTSINT